MALVGPVMLLNKCGNLEEGQPMEKVWTDEKVAALVSAKDKDILRLNQILAEKTQELLRVYDEDQRADRVSTVEPREVALVIDRAAPAAHNNTRPHAVAAAHAALDILTSGRDYDKIGTQLVKEMSKWLEATRRATLEQAAQTVEALR
jgi:hypothetical protein